MPCSPPVEADGRRISATASPSPPGSGAGTAESLLRRMLELNSRLANFVPFIDPDGTIEPGKLQTALQYGFCVVRWHQHDAGRP